MGGGGSYYDRDVYQTKHTYSDNSEKHMSRRTLDNGMDPKDKYVQSESEAPLVLVFDVTGSMGSAPKVALDKGPLLAGQLAIRKYLGEGPELLIAAVGDVTSDDGPLQVGEFSHPRSLDSWFQRVWIEGNGGGTTEESYEFMAYFFANRVELPNAKRPFLIFFGDEGFREQMTAKELKVHFGGQHATTSSRDAFRDLLEKFQGNVFRVQRQYGNSSEHKVIVGQWKQVLGDERVLEIGLEDKAVGDVILGILAIMGGTRTLDEYCEDMRTRKNATTQKAEPQSEQRIELVRGVLEPLTAIAPKHGGSNASWKDLFDEDGRQKRSIRSPSR